MIYSIVCVKSLFILYTVKSFVSLVKYLFTLEGVTVFLSQRISQDPIEKFFGCIRQKGCTNDNPNVSEFCKNTQTLRVVDSVCKPAVRGNCRGHQHNQSMDITKENEHIPKRKKIRRKTL